MIELVYLITLVALVLIGLQFSVTQQPKQSSVYQIVFKNDGRILAETPTLEQAVSILRNSEIKDELILKEVYR